jgi:gamma-glutamyl-gamma-aminobutyrate hydrolase PuuD
MFTGGEDVTPSLYGAKQHPTTYSNLSRDLEEKAVFEKVKPTQLCIGICRGAQFLCVMNGGKLIQNVNNHAQFGTHPIRGLKYSDDWEITSTHHQMQYPFNLEESQYAILYYAPRRSQYYEGEGIQEPIIEPEIVLYKVEGKPKCLAIQGHPEMMRSESPTLEMLNKLVDTYVIK